MSGLFLPPPEVLNARPPLARELTWRRIQAGISQRTLAERVGVHMQSISFYETARMVPSARTLAKLKAELGWK